MQLLRSCAILFKAARLAELGQICLATFGEKFTQVVPFTDVIDDHQLIRSLEQIDFSASQSNFGALLEGVGQTFKDNYAAQQSTITDILIVLSDGQVTDREGVGAAYRQLVHDKILPIFILFDPKIFM